MDVIADNSCLTASIQKVDKALLMTALIRSAFLIVISQ
jgi:hypothetical protein